METTQGRSRRKQAWFRAALLVLFVAEAVAFNRFVGPLDASAYAGIIGVAALLVLPFALGAFRRILPICAFYMAFLFAFAGLIFVPSVTAARANRALQMKCARVKVGMTRQQVTGIFSGYSQEAFPSFAEMLAETLRNQGYQDCVKLNCGNRDYSNSNFYAVTRGRFAHGRCAQITYNWRGHVVDASLYDVPEKYVPEKQNFAAVNSAIRAIRGFLWLFTKDCAYDSSK